MTVDPLDLGASALRLVNEPWPTTDLATTVGLGSWPGGLPDQKRLSVEAGDLRRAIHRLFRAVATQVAIPPDVAFALNRVLDAGCVRARLLPSVDGATVERKHEADSLLGVLTPIALSAADLATTADPARLRECASDSCSRWFYDTSKGGRRKWCSMATCGNRAKASRFRAKQTSG